jgi:hypothetical protein
MNILVHDYHWTQHRIIFTYDHLANACLALVVVVYAVFNLRLNRLFHPVLVRLFEPDLRRPAK